MLDPSGVAWTVADPVLGEALRKRLEELNAASSRALPTLGNGGWLPDVARQATELQKLAEVIGAGNERRRVTDAHVGGRR